MIATYGRLTRNVNGQFTPGPWHIMNNRMPALHLGWCGTRVAGWKAEFDGGTVWPEGKTCSACWTAFKQDRPRAWRKR